GIAQLRRRSGKDRLRQRRVILFDVRMMGEVTVARRGTDQQVAVVESTHRLETEPVDVDDAVRVLDVKLHQVDEGGAAGKEADAGALLRGRRGRTCGNRGLEVGGADEIEGLHVSLLS